MSSHEPGIKAAGSGIVTESVVTYVTARAAYVYHAASKDADDVAEALQ